MGNVGRRLKKWFILSAATFLLLILLHLALPALLLFLQIPSFSLGQPPWWVLRWQNDASGTGIQFNLLPLWISALVVGLVMMLFRFHRRGEW